MRAKRRCMHGKRLRRSPMKQKIARISDEQIKPKTGQVTTGGIGLLVKGAKKVFEGYGKTNPDIVKSARQMPGKI
mgnify:CR=1 FL=1